MKVKYIGKTKMFEVWGNQDLESMRHIEVKCGDIFNTDQWYSFLSVVTDKGEWICDVDCTEFPDEFEWILGGANDKMVSNCPNCNKETKGIREHVDYIYVCICDTKWRTKD